MTSTRVDAAIEQARQAARSPASARPPDGRPRGRRLAIGDAQGPLLRYLELLDAHDALGDDGTVRDDVHLVSLGDHFDWGPPSARVEATRDGMALLAWLAAHPPDQVTIILGNHDLARVGELAEYDEVAYAQARGEADLAYRPSAPPEAGLDALEATFRARHPEAPSAESVARDHSCFSVPQRALVTSLLCTARAKLVHAEARDLLCLHAGVTVDELKALGLSDRERSDAHVIEAAIAAHLARAVEAWSGRGRLDIGVLHRSGSGRSGEARGITCHRPAHPSSSEPAELEGPPRKRFDPRSLPRDLTQVIGHIRDPRCRKLLAPWVVDARAPEGPLRTLTTDGHEVAYRSGVASFQGSEARMIFADGGLQQTSVEAYEIVDLIAREPARRG